jgi:hypothetical protein
MVLIRSVIETIVVVIRLCADPKALTNFYAGTMGSTKAVNAANKLFPVFGRIYAMLSNEFVHIGENQAAFERMGDYSKDDEDLKLILTSMKVTAWVMYVTTELVFIEFVPRPGIGRSSRTMRTTPGSRSTMTRVKRNGGGRLSFWARRCRSEAPVPRVGRHCSSVDPIPVTAVMRVG